MANNKNPKSSVDLVKRFDQYSDWLLKEDGYESARISSNILLTPGAREWDRRRVMNDPWPSLAKRQFNSKTGRYEMSDAAATTEQKTDGEKVAWFKPDNFTTQDGRPITGMKLRPADGQLPKFFLSRYAATPQEIEWAKATGFKVIKPVDHGPAWWETGASQWDELTGTGSKDASQAPVWGYKMTPKKVPFLNLRHRIDNHVGPVYLQVMQFPEFLRGNEYTPCAPSKDEVTEFLPRGAATQLSLFGVKGVSSPRKYEHKQAAMNRALSEAFRPRELRPIEQFENPLHLSSNPDDEVGNSWTPVSADPLMEMLEKEEEKRRVRDTRIALKNLEKMVGSDKYKLLVMSAEGKTNKEISEELRSKGKDISPEAVKKALQRIRTQLKEVA